MLRNKTIRKQPPQISSVVYVVLAWVRKRDWLGGGISGGKGSPNIKLAQNFKIAITRKPGHRTGVLVIGHGGWCCARADSTVRKQKSR